MITQSERLILTESVPVITPRHPDARHSFGAVSHRESTLFTSERPGHPGKNGVTTEIVKDWIVHIKSKGIRNVLIIMKDDEFGVYEVDLKGFYEEAGLKVYHILRKVYGIIERIG
jgi:hypothetical protein